MPSAQDRLRQDWRDWVRAADPNRPDKLDAFDVGVLPIEAIRALRQRPTPVEVGASLVTITQAQLNHLRRDSKQARGAALSEADIKRLPDIIAKPEAVLWDNEEQPGLLFAFNAPEKKAGNFFLRIEFAAQIKIAPAEKQPLTTNAVRSAGYVHAHNLNKQRYELLTGKLKER